MRYITNDYERHDIGKYAEYLNKRLNRIEYKDGRLFNALPQKASLTLHLQRVEQSSVRRLGVGVVVEQQRGVRCTP